MSCGTTSHQKNEARWKYLKHAACSGHFQKMLTFLIDSATNLMPRATKTVRGTDDPERGQHMLAELRLPDGQFVLIIRDAERVPTLIAFMDADKGERLRLNADKTQLVLSGRVFVPVTVRNYPAHPGRVHVHYRAADGNERKAESVLRHLVGTMLA